MTCREIEPLLARMAWCEGTPKIALDAARHLARCAACAETLIRLREMVGLLDRVPKVEVPASFTRRVMRAIPRKARGAVSLLIVALITLAAFVSFGTAGERTFADFRSPLEVGTAVLAALAEAGRTILALLGALGDASGIPPILLPVFASRSLLHVLVLSALALATLAASGAAFGGGALQLLRERRSSRPPLR